MAIPVARVHLSMAHAALPGLLPTPPKCMMLPTPPCVVILPISLPPKPSRADAAERWDAHKIKPGSSSPTSSSGGRSSLDGDSSSPGRASSCERWDSDKKKSASSSASRTNSPGRSSSSSSSSRADSEERWDARKKPVSRASSTAGRWDAHKKPMAPRTRNELDDGESSGTGSNDMEYLDMPPLPESAFYAGPGFMADAPDPSMLPIPTLLMLRVA